MTIKTEKTIWAETCESCGMEARFFEHCDRCKHEVCSGCRTEQYLGRTDYAFCKECYALSIDIFKQIDKILNKFLEVK